MVFLDEPTSGVDPLSRRRFWRLIDEMSREGVTVFVTTHYLDEAEHCDRLALLHAGRLVALGTSAELKAVYRDSAILEVSAPRVADALELLGAQPWAHETSVFGDRIHVVVDEAVSGEARVRELFESSGLTPVAVERVAPSLEDVFIHHVSEEGSVIMVSIKKIRAVGMKELRQIRRDPMSLLMLLGLPAFMLVLYGYALNFDVRHVALAVQDRDLSPASRDLVASFVNSTYFDITATPAAGEDLERLTERRIARAVLVIPEGHAVSLASGRTAAVHLLLDGADSTTAATVLGYAGALVAEANTGAVRVKLLASGSASPGGIDYQPRVWYNPELDSTQFIVPGLVGMLLMLTAVLSTALSVVRERERGSMEQLRVAPLGTLELVLGKTLPYLVISFAATVVVLGAARVLFDVVVRGPYLALFFATLLYLVGALGLGLLISTVAETQAIAFQMSLLVSLLPSVLLSGFIFQIRAMPPALQMITRLVPARYYLVILRGVILKGTGLGPHWDQMGYLALFALVVLGLTARRLVHQES